MCKHYFAITGQMLSTFCLSPKKEEKLSHWMWYLFPPYLTIAKAIGEVLHNFPQLPFIQRSFEKNIKHFFGVEYIRI